MTHEPCQRRATAADDGHRRRTRRPGRAAVPDTVIEDNIPRSQRRSRRQSSGRNRSVRGRQPVRRRPLRQDGRKQPTAKPVRREAGREKPATSDDKQATAIDGPTGGPEGFSRVDSAMSDETRSFRTRTTSNQPALVKRSLGQGEPRPGRVRIRSIGLNIFLVFLIIYEVCSRGRT